MKFSQRMGITPATKAIQIDSMDDDLRNRLWNGFKLYIIDVFFKTDEYGGDRSSSFIELCKLLWHAHYKLAIDTMPYRTNDAILFIREKFFKGEWFEVYDLLDFIGSNDFGLFRIDKKGLITFCNKIFENEFSGYRFINNQISPITNQQEIAEIETAIYNSQQFTPLTGANIHLKKALDKLSDRKNPDYRNSIKESISAVESVSKVISGNGKDSLGAAIDKIKGKVKIHKALEQGFKNLYGYTSDSDGIRHALMDAPTCDFEDAKFMLVSCSSFINYLIAKADKAGISLDNRNTIPHI